MIILGLGIQEMNKQPPHTSRQRWERLGKTSWSTELTVRETPSQIKQEWAGLKVAVTVTEGSWLWSLLWWLLLSSMHHAIFPPIASQAYPGVLLGLTWVIPLDSIDEDSQPQGALGYLCPGIIISLTWPKFPHDNAVVWRYPKCSFCLCCYVPCRFRFYSFFLPHFFSTDIFPTNFYVLWIFKSSQNFTHQRPKIS